MSILTLVLISVGLSVDCFAVAIAAGMKYKEMKIFHAVKIGLFFGGFQAAMTLMGWAGGTGFKKIIENYDHWVAFGLLAAAAIHMIFEAFEKEDECGCGGKECESDKEEKNPFDTGVLLVMAFATSIDALAVGISFGLIAVSIVIAAAIIGAGSFIFSFAGCYVGKTAGGLFGRKINLLGAAILIGIGVKILLEHLGFIN